MYSFFCNLTIFSCNGIILIYLKRTEVFIVFHLVVFVSGSGSTLQSIIDHIQSGELEAKINLVVSDNPSAFALVRAKMSNIPTYVIKTKNMEERDTELIRELAKYEVDLIVLAGYLKMIGNYILDNYTVINTHPSLLPKFGGKGMYGINVHKAVIEAGEKESGVTCHYVNSKYDEGNIIAQTKVLIDENETPETLAKKVQDAEKPQLIQVIKGLIEQSLA